MKRLVKFVRLAIEFTIREKRVEWKMVYLLLLFMFLCYLVVVLLLFI